MFKRKLYANLLEWKESSHGTTALLIEGARRVGKTTLVRDFAEREYAAHVYIDFANVDKAVTDLFVEHRGDIGTFLRMLQLHFGKELPRRNALVIFDEVQRFPMAREMVKYLVADGRFDYIETGSLVSIKKNVESIVIPSEEDRLRLCPLDFEEYLWALDKRLLADAIREARQTHRSFPPSLHNQCERLFDEYLLVGGMPQAVANFVEDEDYARCDKTKRRILSLYAEDMAKFGGTDARKAYSIFQELPGQLSMGSKRFRFSRLDSNARYRDYESAVRWLEDSHTVNVCRKCTDPNVAYRLTSDDTALKCYMGDTGLLVSHAFPTGPELMDVYRSIQFGKLAINRGMIVENAVAQQLRAAGNELFFHTWEEPPLDASSKSKRAREIDFLITKGFADAAGKPRVCPVEVKSSKSYSTVSLDDFRSRYGKRAGNEIVLHPKPMAVEGRREYLPLYMSFCV